MLYFTENKLTRETDNSALTWTVMELLETPELIAGEPLAARNAAMRKAAEILENVSGELPENARLQADFWNNFQAAKISEETYIYPGAKGSSKQWELTVKGLGLFYKDLSNEYDSRPGWVSEQLWSDFWFYGPLKPMPALSMRKKIIGMIRETFLDPDSPAAATHFELFEYPELTNSTLEWTEGDYKRKDFITVRNNGIETGYSTWRDVQPMVGFISFERFLHELSRPSTIFTPEIRASIEQFLGRKSRFGLLRNEAPLAPQPPTPREKMDRSESLLKADPNSKEGTEVLISLLEYEMEESYWRNYVFSCFYKLRGNIQVENFILECLRGDNEIHFKKAVDVLQMWGMYGHKSLQDKTLLLQLNWEDASANDPEFREAMEKVVKIIR